MKKATKKQVYYHGTSADNLQDILQNGISCNTDKIWSCSCDEAYLWSVEKLAIANSQEDEEMEYKLQEGFRMASESAQLACSTSKDCRLVVIKIMLDPSEVEEDNSCENMAGSGAVVIRRAIMPSEFVEVSVSNDLSLIKAYFISLIMDRDYCNIEFSHIEQKIAEGFKKAELYPEDIEEMIEWTSMKVAKELKIA